MSKANVHVAIAILLHQNRVLVGWRNAEQHQGNKHEFPGGKVEQGETPVVACRREVREEVGIDIVTWQVFDLIRHEYDDVIVHLHVFHAAVELSQIEQITQPWTWYERSALADLNFPKANRSMLKRLNWLPYIKISENLSDLNGLADHHYLYWRTQYQPTDKIDIAQFKAEDLARLIVNIESWSDLQPLQQQAVAAIHLRQAQLMQMQAQDLQLGRRYIAACHDREALIHAQQIGCDAVLLSPVQPTKTHPQSESLGWEKFAELSQLLQIPVFALGGLKPEDLALAQSYKAYGVAGVSGF